MTARTSPKPHPKIDGQVIVLRPVPPALPGPLISVRSTLITSSLKTLQERGHLDAYFTKLPPELRDTIRGTVAGVWLPVDLAYAHYVACDSLGLSQVQLLDIGRAVGDKVQGTLLGTLVTLAKQAGATPWTLLEKLDRLFDRLCIGGGLVVTRVGPKDAVIEIINAPLLEIPYFATAWRGVIQGMCELFCTKAYAKNGPMGTAAMKTTSYISWA